MEKSKHSPELLMQVFNFTPEDLAANMEGEVSSRQEEVFEYESPVIGIAILVAIIALSFFIAFLTSLPSPDDSARELLMVSGISMLIALGLIIMDAILRSQQNLEEIEMACGMVVLDMQNQGRTPTSYFLEVDKEIFQLTSKQFLAFKNGEPYCIYYNPRNKQILSVRPLQKVETPFFE